MGHEPVNMLIWLSDWYMYRNIGWFFWENLGRLILASSSVLWGNVASFVGEAVSCVVSWLLLVCHLNIITMYFIIKGEEVVFLLDLIDYLYLWIWRFYLLGRNR